MAPVTSTSHFDSIAEQPPNKTAPTPTDQPVNVEVPPGFSVRAILSFSWYSCEQVVGHSIPGDSEVTVPDPLPVSTTVTGNLASSINLALTSVFPASVTWHSVALGSTSQPVHPTNSNPATGSSVRTIFLPGEN